ncbi:MAG: hypothetical protein QXU40_01470 [Candidatus Pacearchaeota archaeon]
MKSIEMLQKKVKRMASNEERRRKEALEFVDSVASALTGVAKHLFHHGSEWERVGYICVFNWKSNFDFQVNKEAKLVSLDQVNKEKFVPLKETYGTLFWDAIEDITKWIPNVVKKIDDIENKREDLLDLLKEEKVQEEL